MKELSNRSDVCVVDVCSVCNKLSILCSCERLQALELGSTMFKCRLPMKAVEFMLKLKVSTDADVLLLTLGY